MNIKPPEQKPDYVIGRKYLPANPIKLLYPAWLYALTTKVYELPLWADYTAYGVLLVLFAVVCVKVGKETEVNPFG